MRVGAVQMISTGAEAGPNGQNLAKAERFARDAHRAGVKILCFPECASTSFDCEYQYLSPVPFNRAALDIIPTGPCQLLFRVSFRQ